ncbi:MAG: DegV family protein [Lachnospiraceae bacterium]|nr:DegV family protein [Lachnospiraceae bacterium]
MSRVAIATDSNSGITQKEAEKLGIKVLPMPFIINEETYYEDINLSQDKFYEMLEDDAEISTTQPSPESVMNLWDDLLKDYDEIVYIPMSSGLSGSCSTAYMLSQEEEYDGKVFVVDNQRISVTQKQSVLDSLAMAKEGKSGEEIRQILLDTKMDSSIYIMVDTLKYLKKGGRVTPAAAALGTLLKLKPVLQIKGEKLDAFAKARSVANAKKIMIEAAKKDAEELYGGMDNTWIAIAHTDNFAEAENFKQEILEAFPGYDGNVIITDSLSLSVSCHIGPGAIAVAVTQKL